MTTICPTDQEVARLDLAARGVTDRSPLHEIVRFIVSQDGSIKMHRAGSLGQVRVAVDLGIWARSRGRQAFEGESAYGDPQAALYRALRQVWAAVLQHAEQEARREALDDAVAAAIGRGR